MRMDIETDTYLNFKQQWDDGAFQGQRLGQAFYNFFDLHRLSNQEQLCNLYELDGDEARMVIHTTFRLS